MARRKPAKVHGFIAIDKASGPSSRAVVNKVGWLLGERRCGHTGTLDPAATGLLIIAFGEATKAVRWLTSRVKTYQTDVVFGASTTTDDAAGEIVETCPVPDLVRELVGQTAASPVGLIDQVPPSVSALKKAGVRDYERVRRGETVEREARRVQLDAVRTLDVGANTARFELTVGSGFYVRSWARDLGAKLGTLAHVGTLRRTKGSGFDVEDAVTVDALEGMRESARLSRLVPVGDVLQRVLPVLTVDAETSVALGYGKKPLAPEHVLAWPFFVVVDETGALICVARIRNDKPGGPRLQVERGFGKGARTPAQIA